MRCLIVDDEELARQEMRRLLRSHPSMEVAGEAADVATAFQLAARFKPEVIFLDVELRGETGFDLVERLPDPLPQIVFVTAYDRYAIQGFESNALDYLLKPVEAARLAETVRRLASSIKIKSRARDYASLLRMKVGEPARLEKLGLTSREAEVLFWVAHGKSNPEIARLLGKSAETVKKQIQNILNKLEIKTRVQAAVLASEALQLRRK
jgi:DNA-binding NarL/FixJ family response regulator